MIRINAINCPTIARAAATITLRSGMVYFNSTAVKLLNIKQGDKYGFDYDEEADKLYLVIDPKGFPLRKKDTGFAFCNMLFQVWLRKIVKSQKCVLEIKEFNQGRWPLTIIKR